MATAMTDRAAQMFPRLTPAQMDRISRIGRRRAVHAGEVLFDYGDKNTPFFVVVSGTVDVVRPVGDREEPVTVWHPGEFSGEMNMLSSRLTLARARVASDGEVIVVDRDALRALVQRDPELSELIMRAFILRRTALMAADNNDLVLLGSRHSGNTTVIREFLSRNGQPFTYEDVETDPSVQTLFDRFHIG
ncbi:MAG TPA: cyclic nucleotide-binding domain-containing protein, partial [Polyangiaceae bacterium]